MLQTRNGKRARRKELRSNQSTPWRDSHKTVGEQPDVPRLNIPLCSYIILIYDSENRNGLSIFSFDTTGTLLIGMRQKSNTSTQSFQFPRFPIHMTEFILVTVNGGGIYALRADDSQDCFCHLCYFFVFPVDGSVRVRFYGFTLVEYRHLRYRASH